MTTTPDLPSLPELTDEYIDGLIDGCLPNGGATYSTICGPRELRLFTRRAIEAYELGARSTAAQPAGFKLVPVDLLARFPELNPSNYDHDDACAVNAWGVEVVLAASGDSTPPSKPVQGNSIRAPRPEPEAADEDRGPAPPRVTGSPNEIWLNYGDIEDDCTHDECYHAGGVTWCQDKVFDSDVRYVLAPPAASQQADLEAE